MSDAAAHLLEARNVTRILPGIVPTTLVHDIDLVIGPKTFVAITGPVGLGQVVACSILLGPARPADRRRGADPRPLDRAHGREASAP